MRNSNLSRRASVSNFVLRVLTAAIVVFAPMAAYAAKGPCNLYLHSPVVEGGPYCVSGQYQGERKSHDIYYVCTGTNIEDDCNPSAVTNRLYYTSTTFRTAQQSISQKAAEDSELQSIVNAFNNCKTPANWTGSIGGVAVVVSALVAGTAVTIAFWWSLPILAGVVGTTLSASGVVATIGSGLTVVSSGMIESCTEKYNEAIGIHNARKNNCMFVNETANTPQEIRGNSCQ